MIPKQPLIDRQTEVNLFCAILVGTRSERILQLRGESKMGKTKLLQVFRDLVCTDGSIQCAFAPMSEQRQDYADVLNLLVQELTIRAGGFSRYADVQQRQLVGYPRLEARNITQIFSWMNLSQLTRPDPDNEQRSEQAIRDILTRAFLQDLDEMARNRRIVILLDSLEKASSSLSEWISQRLLSGLSQIPNVTTVVVGQRLITPSPTWSNVCCTCELRPVADNECHEYCIEMGVTLPREDITKYVKVLRGNPGLFVDIVLPIADELSRIGARS